MIPTLSQVVADFVVFSWDKQLSVVSNLTWLMAFLTADVYVVIAAGKKIMHKVHHQINGKGKT